MLKDLMGEKEEIVQQYLEEHEKILIAALGQPEWVYNIVLPKFKFGLEYVSDFVIVYGQSYSYWIQLLELESPTASIFTKQGEYARWLNHAIKQVNEWSDWIQRNESYFKECLQKALCKKDPSFQETFDYTRRFIIGSSIIIGRRENLSEEDNRRRFQELEKRNLDIIPYDRLIDMEERMIQFEKQGKNFNRILYDDF